MLASDPFSFSFLPSIFVECFLSPSSDWSSEDWGEEEEVSLYLMVGTHRIGERKTHGRGHRPISDQSRGRH